MSHSNSELIPIKRVAYERHNKLTMHRWIKWNQKFIESNWVFPESPSSTIEYDS